MTSPSPNTGSVTSHDGTTIGYRHSGDGPGVVLLHGGMQSSHNLVDLGTALSDSFSVYLPDRRGRGLSGPASENHSIQDECEDLDALLKKTGAHNVFGLSAGGVIALQAALTYSSIRNVAVYEPPLFTEQSSPTDWGPQYEREVAQGKLAEAVVTVGRGTGVFPRVARLVPRFLVVLVMIRALKHETKSDDEVSLTELIPTVYYDLQMMNGAHREPESFKNLRAEVLLLGGSNSPTSLQTTLDELQTVLPHAIRSELSGLDHLGPDNDGNPERIAEELRYFFS